MIDARRYRGVPVITVVPVIARVGNKVYAYWPERGELDLTPEERFFASPYQEQVFDMTGIMFTNP